MTAAQKKKYTQAIANWPLKERPREKLLLKGSESLSFNTDTEKKVAEGSKVDTIWEATIGNMGRVIYIFEVQTKGSTDSLILNLLKALQNQAVQGVVAFPMRHNSAKSENTPNRFPTWDQS
jgi:hypothetical protein